MQIMSTNLMSIDDLKAALPVQFKPKANQALLEHLHARFSDPDLTDTFMDTFVAYSHVLTQGRFQVEKYIDAVKYVAYKSMGLTNFDSYTKTFPDRYLNFLNKGTSIDTLHVYVSAYNKNPLVIQLSEQVLVAPSILYQEEFHKALMVQVEIMNNKDVSPKTRSDAAAHVMNITQPPQVKKLQLDVGLKDSANVVGSFMDKLAEYATLAQQQISNGQRTATDVIEHTIIDV